MARFTEQTYSFGRQHPGDDAVIIADHPLAQQLIAGYLFNNAGAEVLLDLTGRFPIRKIGANVGRDVGNFNNYGLRLFGTASNYYDIGTGIRDLLGNVVNFSMSCWVKLASTATSSCILSNTTSSSSSTFDGFVIKYESGVGWQIAGSDGAHTFTSVSLSDTITVGNWYHVAVTCWDAASGRAQVWVDGGRKTLSSTFTFKPLASGGNWRIGHTTETSAASALNGTLDHLYIWQNRRLTDRDVRRLYEEPFALFQLNAPSKKRIFATATFPKTFNLSVTDSINFNQSVPVRVHDRRIERRRFLYEPRARKAQTDTLALTDSAAIKLVLSIAKVDSVTFQSSLPIVIDDRRLQRRRFVFVRQRTDHPTADTISFGSVSSYTGVFKFSLAHTIGFADNVGGNVFNESVTQSIGIYDRSTLRKIFGRVVKRLELDRAELGSEVNWQDPITKGLLFCVLLNERAGPAHNIAFDNFRGPTNSIWEISGYRDTQAWAEDTKLNISAGVTLLAQTFWNGVVSTINIARKADSSGATGGYALRMNGIQPRFGVFSGGFLTAVDGPTITKGSYTLAGTYDNNNISLYSNGKQSATSVVGAGKMSAPTGFGTLIGDSAFNLNCTLVMIWNRALSRAELADVGVNPLRLIRKPTKKRVILSEKVYSDTLDVVDQLIFGHVATEGSVFNRTPTDSLVLTDVPFALDMHRYVVDAISFQDLFYPGSIWRRAVLDALRLSDYGISNSHYYFASPLSLSDSVKRGGINYRSVSERLIITQGISEPLWDIANEIVFRERVTTIKTINVTVSDAMAFYDSPPRQSPESVADILSIDQSVYLDESKLQPKIIDAVSFSSRVAIGRVSKYSVTQTVGLGSYVSFYTPTVRVP